jgi:hypothetical protein
MAILAALTNLSAFQRLIYVLLAVRKESHVLPAPVLSHTNPKQNRRELSQKYDEQSDEQ